MRSVTQLKEYLPIAPMNFNHLTKLHVSENTKKGGGGKLLSLIYKCALGAVVIAHCLYLLALMAYYSINRFLL